MKKIIFLLLALILTSRFVSARDINLDEVYLKADSAILKKLMNKKLEAYNKINSTLIDKNIIFAGWTSGKRIIYIKEYKNIYYNKIFLYYPETRVRNEFISIKGAIIQAKLSQNGKFLIIKKTVKKGKKQFQNIIDIYNLRNKKHYSLFSQSFFNDFSLDYFGNNIIVEKKNRLLAFNPISRRKKIILPRQTLNSIKVKNTPVLGIVSPGNIKKIILSGGGGNYSAYLFNKNRLLKKVKNITASNEIYWLSNNKIIFRKGGTGHYRICLYDFAKSKEYRLSKSSYNTNLTYSVFSKIASFLEDGLISLFNSRTETISRFPLEGEDITFEPAGNKFLSLFGRHLFLSHKSNLIRSRVDLIDNSKEILNLYKQAYSKRYIWQNRYTKEYLTRKIKAYRAF